MKGLHQLQIPDADDNSFPNFRRPLTKLHNIPNRIMYANMHQSTDLSNFNSYRNLYGSISVCICIMYAPCTSTCNEFVYLLRCDNDEFVGFLFSANINGYASNHPQSSSPITNSLNAVLSAQCSVTIIIIIIVIIGRMNGVCY